MKKILKLVGAIIIPALILGALHFSMVSGAAEIKPDEKASKPLSAQERLKDAIVLYIGSSQAFVNNIETQVDSTNADVKPLVTNGRTLVPVRFISENLGANVKWEQKTTEATVTLGNKVVKFVVGSKKMKVGKKDVELDAAAMISEGRTYLPLRSLVEALGKKVFYDRGLIVIGNDENIFDKTKEKLMIDEVISKVNNLPVVGSYEVLEKLLQNSNSYSANYDRGWVMEDLVASEAVAVPESKQSLQKSKSDDSAASGSSSNTKSSEASSASKDYSTTNVQVQGVDEADVVKTDGEYVYQVNKDRIVIVKVFDESANTSGKMKIMSIMDFRNDNFNPDELYIYSKYLIAVGSYYEDAKYDSSEAKEKKMSRIIPHYRANNTTKAIICDISDRSNIRKIREVEIEGNYVSSRKIGSALYMVANKNSYAYYVDDKVEIQTPRYKDTSVSDKYEDVKCPEIRYFPDFVEANYLTVAAVDLESKEKANVQTFLGAGQNVYASNENLYIAVTNNKYDMTERINTTVYKFSLNKSKVTYLNKGEVPGSILNQFSMDENNGYFRIATTVGDVWGTGKNASKNNLYVLDDTMNLSGKIENIAPGEKIYSVRFMGDKGYMVTFRKVDPLFVMDLKDPTNPKILGKLKIPGYSDYLHPYDENHIIGFGKDAEVDKDTAFYQGMKIALFDVSDVNNPIEKFSQVIGDRGTDSELLTNHKALLFSKEKNLLAFPVTVMEMDDRGERDVWSYGEFAFQGAYIYKIDTKNGFELRGKISHLNQEEYLKAGDYYYNPDKYVERILYIDDMLYTMSKGMFKVNSLKDLKERDSIEIPE